MRDIDVLGDEAFRGRMLRWSYAIAGATAIGVVLAFAVLRPGFVGVLVELAAGIVVCLVALPVHELLHGLAFRLLGGRECRVSFGYVNACLYTRTNDAVLTRGRFEVVLLTPSVVLTILLLAGCTAAGMPAAGALAAGLHLSGCTGDLAMAWAIHAEPGVSHVQDTEAGCRLLSDLGA